MKNYVVYTVGSGEITRSGKIQESLFDMITPGAGEALLEGVGGQGTHYVNQAGELTAYSELVAIDKQQAPDYPAAWSNTILGWTDLRALEDFRAKAWVDVKARRDLVEFGGFVWDGSTFDSDPLSQSRLQGACQLASLAAQGGTPFSIDWTLADNTVRTLNGLEMLSVGEALGLHVTTAFDIARQLREDIYAATTQQELEAITWPETSS